MSWKMCYHIPIYPNIISIQNLKSDLSLWQLGTLPPGLIAFHGHVHVIDPFWHMLGLGYQENTSSADVKSAGVIHFNGRAKPWLEIAFPKLRPFWAKYVDFSDKFIKSCHIRASQVGFSEAYVNSVDEKESTVYEERENEREFFPNSSLSTLNAR